MLVEKSYLHWLKQGFIGGVCTSLLNSFASSLVCVSRTRVVLLSHRVNCNRWKTLIVVLITSLWILLSICQLLFVVMMGFLQFLIGLVDWLNLFLCRLPAQLLTWQNCSLIIGCVSMVFLVRSLVIVMFVFNLLFGKVCVSVLIHA